MTPPPKTASLQAVFDFVVAHLREQGERSANTDGFCFYRDGAGRKCAIGCLITDEDYRPALETRSASNIMTEERLRYLGRYLLLLPTLQRIHDDVLSWDSAGFSPSGERRLQYWAGEWGLTYPSK